MLFLFKVTTSLLDAAAEGMQGKDIYEIAYRPPHDAYPSAGSWWFENKQERDKYWNEEILKVEEIKE